MHAFMNKPKHNQYAVHILIEIVVYTEAAYATNNA